jgi:hypothetical protein
VSLFYMCFGGVAGVRNFIISKLTLSFMFAAK